MSDLSPNYVIASITRMDLRLDAIERFIAALPGASEVDTGPIRDAVWAIYANAKGGAATDRAEHLDNTLAALSGKAGS